MDTWSPEQQSVEISQAGAPGMAGTSVYRRLLVEDDGHLKKHIDLVSLSQDLIRGIPCTHSRKSIRLMLECNTGSHAARFHSFHPSPTCTTIDQLRILPPSLHSHPISSFPFHWPSFLRCFRPFAFLDSAIPIPNPSLDFQD